jgi:hypothetical protein
VPITNNNDPAPTAIAVASSNNQRYRNEIIESASGIPQMVVRGYENPLAAAVFLSDCRSFNQGQF